MLEKFAQDVAKVLQRACEEARILGHDQVRREHMLLAFAFDQNAYPAKIMKLQGITYAALVSEVERTHGRGRVVETIPPPSSEVHEFFERVEKRAKWPPSSLIPSKIVFDLLAEECVAQLLRSANKHIQSYWEELKIAVADAVEPDVDYTAEAIPMAYGDFTDAANFALMFARIDASIFNGDTNLIGSVSLLVGLVAEQCGIAGKVLREKRLTVRKIRWSENSPDPRILVSHDLDCLKFDAQARRILRNARKISRQQGHRTVGSDHMLLSILMSGDSIARKMISNFFSDLKVLKIKLSKAPISEKREGTSKEFELNQALIRRHNIECRSFSGVGTEEAADDAVERKAQATFDLANLDQASVDVMWRAYQEYSKSLCISFDLKHVFLGLVAHSYTLASQMLENWGVTLIETREVIIEMESLGPICLPSKRLPSDVAELLSHALFVAKSRGAERISPEHMLLAFAQSDDPQVSVLISRLGLDPILLGDLVSDLLKGKLKGYESPRLDLSSPKTPLKIYGMLCRPEVGTAMSVAVDEARLHGISQIGGNYLLLGLLDSVNMASSAAILVKPLVMENVRPALHAMRAKEKTSFSPKDSSLPAPMSLNPTDCELRARIMSYSGPNQLLMKMLAPYQFLEFMRKVERLSVAQGCQSVIVYWSRGKVSRLLPAGAPFGRLVAQTSFIGYFSEGQDVVDDPWCFFVQSPDLSLVLYGTSTQKEESLRKYVCFGAMRPTTVSAAFDILLPLWKVSNPLMAQELEDIRASLPMPGSHPDLVQEVLRLWTEIITSTEPPSRPEQRQTDLMLGPDLHIVFEKALQIALRYRSTFVGAEHLFRALIEVENEPALKLMSLIDLSPDQVIKKLDELVS